jgi:hypothetical protein
MVAIRFTRPENRAEGFLLLVRQGPVRALRGEIYICRDYALATLDQNRIAYERVALPLELNEMDSLRDTPTTVL